MSAWGDVGTTWGDGPPERIIRVPRQVTAAAAPDTADPGPLERRRLERTLTDLRQSLERWHHGDLSGLGDAGLGVIEATRAYLAALDAEETDP